MEGDEVAVVKAGEVGLDQEPSGGEGVLSAFFLDGEKYPSYEADTDCMGCEVITNENRDARETGKHTEADGKQEMGKRSFRRLPKPGQTKHYAKLPNLAPGLHCNMSRAHIRAWISVLCGSL